MTTSSPFTPGEGVTIQHDPFSWLGCLGRTILVVLLITVAIFVWAGGAGKLPVILGHASIPTITTTPLPGATQTPTLPDYSYLRVTAEYLENEQAALDLTSTAAVNAVIFAQAEQQRANTSKQETLTAHYYSLTATIDSERIAGTLRAGTATAYVAGVVATDQAHRTETQTVIRDTQTAEQVKQEESAQVVADRQRWWNENIWVWAIPLLGFVAAIAILGSGVYLAVGVSKMLSLKYSQPIPADEESYDIPARIKIEESRNNGGTLHFDNLELPAEISSRLLSEWITAIINGAPVAEKHWTGYGKPFSDEVYGQLRDAFIAVGLARWNHPTEPRQGWKITRKGWEVLGSIARELHSPTPQPEFYTN